MSGIRKVFHGLARVVCDHCGILVKWGSMSEWHKKSVHGLARVVCDRCGKLLDGIYRMGRHRRIHKEASCVDCQDLEDPFPLPCSRAGLRLPPVRALPHTRPALLLQVPLSSSRPTLQPCQDLFQLFDSSYNKHDRLEDRGRSK